MKGQASPGVHCLRFFGGEEMKIALQTSTEVMNITRESQGGIDFEIV